LSNKKSCDGCTDSSCAASQMKQGETPEEYADRQELTRQLKQIKHKIIVLSGKGGVGKSTVSANLALSLAEKGHKVGLLDVDIHGPSLPRIMGLDGSKVETLEEKLLPVPATDNLKVISIGFLLKGKDDAVIWKGPLKMGVIKQFLKDVDWGELDYLVIDCPPGTGDEPLSVIQIIEQLDGAVIVTTPQDVSTIDVRRSVMFCRTVGLKILGIIENMSGFACPHCGEVTNIFKAGGGENMAKDMGEKFLGRIPLDPEITSASDDGKHYITTFKDSETAKSFSKTLEPLIEELEK
jgi:ATP-binding protein involved in chromosome partitioning